MQNKSAAPVAQLPTESVQRLEDLNALWFGDPFERPHVKEMHFVVVL